MIRKNTCLVLGAGASVDAGFPVGRELLLEICRKLRSRGSDLYKILRELEYAPKDLEDFGRSLYGSMKPSVDAFLENRPKWVELGKRAIAAALIPYEEKGSLVRRHEQQSWYEYLFNQMGTRQDDFQLAPLSIITLNYDRSLEYFLISALVDSYGLSEEEAAKCLGSRRVVHLHGQLGRPHFFDPEGRNYVPNLSPDIVKKCADQIKITHEDIKRSSERRFATYCIEQARVLCFLGFGYHETNILRLEINSRFGGEKLLGSCYNIESDKQRQDIAGKFARDIELGDAREDALTFLIQHEVFD